MTLVKWQDSYSVNVKAIDDQHKALLELVNDLHRVVTERQGNERLLEIVGRMADYAHGHFQLEERHMRELDYPDYEAHKAEHDRFAQKVVELQARLLDGSFVLGLEVINFLRDWWTDHILETDQKYAPLFNEKGLS